MNLRTRRRLLSDYRREHRKRFLKSSVIGFGFLSGLWAGLGVDPGSFVAQWLQTILLAVAPAYGSPITIAFLYGPTLLTVLAVFLAYRRAGFLGFVAVALAYAAGFLLAVLHLTAAVILLLLAIMIGWFAARRG
jgi:hypothetical protein